MVITFEMDKMKCYVDGAPYNLVPAGDVPKINTLADEFEKYLGTKEYDGIVATIQKWYYGKLVKDAWCATSVSYFANLIGVLDQLGGKAENVDVIKDRMNSKGRLDCTALYGGGHYKPKRGDLIFFSSKNIYKDCTHVGVVVEINHDTGYLKAISGNTSNKIGYTTHNYFTDKYVVAFGNVTY